MKVNYAENTKQWIEGLRLIQHATEVLTEVLPNATALLLADWSAGVNSQGSPVYTLRIADREDSATGQFELDELRTSHYLRFRMSHLYGELLQARNHRQLRMFQGSEVGS